MYFVKLKIRPKTSRTQLFKLIIFFSSGVDSEEVEAKEEKVSKKSSKKISKKAIPRKTIRIPREVHLGKNGAKSATQKDIESRKNSKLDSMVKNEDKNLTGNFGQFRSQVAAKSDLNLSESSSSEDEESESIKKVEKPEQPKQVLVDTVPKIKPPVVSSSDDDEEMASQLVNLVRIRINVIYPLESKFEQFSMTRVNSPVLGAIRIIRAILI